MPRIVVTCVAAFGEVESTVASVTVEELERAISITADVMVRHNLPQIMPTLKRLEAERDRLLREGDPIEYAKRVLASLQQNCRLAA